MSNSTVTYRTVGSAALKPEYTESRAEAASIIDFESLQSVSSRQRVYRAPRKLTFTERATKVICSDPLLGSLDKAFAKQDNASYKSKATFVRCVAGVFFLYLALIVLGL